MIKKSLMILPLIFLFSVLVKADIPPDDDFTLVSMDLVVETKEDLSDYRFFLRKARAILEKNYQMNSRKTFLN